MDELLEAATPRPWTIRNEFNLFGPGPRLVATFGGHSSNVKPETVYQTNIANANLTARIVSEYAALCRCKLSLRDILRYPAGCPKKVWDEASAALAALAEAEKGGGGA